MHNLMMADDNYLLADDYYLLEFCRFQTKLQLLIMKGLLLFDDIEMPIICERLYEIKVAFKSE